MAIITAEVLAACGVPPEEKEGRAKAALEQKYQREFEIIQVYPQKFGDLYYEVQAYAVDEPQLRFSAAIDTGDSNISDSYVERRVCAAISNRAAENLDGLPGYYYLLTRAVGPQPFADDPQIGIREYAALDPLNWFRIDLFVVPDRGERDAFYKSLGALMGGLEYLTVKVRLYVVDEEQNEAVQEYWETNETENLEYKEMTSVFFSVELPFEKGALTISEEEFATMVGDKL